MDFFRAQLGNEWRFHQLSPDVLKKLVAAYQKPWIRTLPDGSAKVMDTGADHNSAVKPIAFLKRVCGWAVAEPEPGGGFLLDADPFQRIRKSDMPRARQSETKPRSVAPEGYAKAMYQGAKSRGANGQFEVMFAGEACQGRRLSEWRELPQSALLTDVASIRSALEEQSVRRVLHEENHIHDGELDEAARAYHAVSGLAIHFTGGKSAKANPDSAAQYDRVVPVGPWLADVLMRYRKEHWLPLGLPDDAPLFPADRNKSKPTSKRLVLTWWERTEATVAELEGVRIPSGMTHTLRKRFRARLRDQDPKAVKFFMGLSIRSREQSEDVYLPVPWRLVVDVARRADERLRLER